MQEEKISEPLPHHMTLSTQSSKSGTHVTHDRKIHTRKITSPPSNFSILDQLTHNPFDNHPVNTTNQSKWVAFTLRERAFRPPLSPTLALPRAGSRLPPSRLLSRSASSPRRVLPPPRSVLSSVTATVLPRSRLSLVRFPSQFSNRGDGKDTNMWMNR